MSNKIKFNLKAAKAGAKIQTANGFPARIVCFDAVSRYPIIALIKIDEYEQLCMYDAEGESDCNQLDNLFMAPIIVEGWINIYTETNGQYKTEYEPFHITPGDADRLANKNRVTKVKVKFEVE